MRVAVLASGGKDSSYCAWWSELQGWDVEAMITVGVTGEDSMMYQMDNTAVAALQATSMGVPWLPVSTLGGEDVEIADLERGILGMSDSKGAFSEIWPVGLEVPGDLELKSERLEIDGLVVGALRSDYQKTRLEMMCERIGVRSFCPLWHNPGINHMESLLEHGFEVIFTSVSAEGLDSEWIGKSLDWELLDELRMLSLEHRFNIDGEGGEFETLVIGGPHLRRKISIEGVPVWEGSRGSLKLISGTVE
ncbi:MAG: ATP-binding protein [Euryarchaeota archaeon]|nr:ATP-binding protein [Euryarchaeota archaeon]